MVLLVILGAAILVGCLSEFIKRQRKKRRNHEEEMRFAALLEDVTLILDSSTNLKQSFSRISPLIVPAFADWLMIEVIRPRNTIQRVWIYHPDPAQSNSVKALTRMAPDRNAKEGIARALREGQSILWPTNPEGKNTPSDSGEEVLFFSATDQKQIEIIRQLRIKSYITALGYVNKKPIIALNWMRSGQSRPYRGVDLKRANRIAKRLAYAFELSEATRTAKDTTEIFQHFLSSVSHEMRKPLTSADQKIAAVIRGLNAEDLRKGLNPIEVMNIPDPEEYQKLLIEKETSKEVGLEGILTHARAIQLTLTKLRRYVDDLQDISTITNDTFSVASHPESLRSVIGEFCEVLLGILGQKSIQLKAQIKDTLPNVNCDRDRIEQVLSILVGTLARFSPQGSAVVIQAERAGTHAIISIKNTAVVLRDRPLTGLNLALAKGIVSAHSGSLWTENEQGQGTNFLFTLPLVERRPVSTAPSTLLPEKMVG